MAPITRLDATRGEYAHRFPRFLPDGRRFLYLVRSTRADARGLFLGSLDESELKRRILPDDANAALALGPDRRDYLLFVRDRVLMAQAFDTIRGAVVEAPMAVDRHVIPGEGGRLAPFTAAARTLVYRRVGRGENRLVWVNRTGIPRTRSANPVRTTAIRHGPLTARESRSRDSIIATARPTSGCSKQPAPSPND